MALIPWLRRRLLTGFFVSVPLIISVFALVWIFGIIDGLTAPLVARVAATVLGHDPEGAERLIVSAVPPFERAHYLDGFNWPDKKFRFKPDWPNVPFTKMREVTGMSAATVAKTDPREK